MKFLKIEVFRTEVVDELFRSSFVQRCGVRSA